ncbi:hypothetical protein [Cupriavidus sp. BIS7]|uniref:hypothetical protein n=1 Tax=Cupriavidus sp. BIS7 TaxID=1217718 RepID=UPI0012F6FA67|nr:hypothetical protein [Cupriavidus sp. BIS7]
MKHAITAAALAAASLIMAPAARAGTIFVQPNRAGGVIELTSTACHQTDWKSAHQVIASGASGHTTYGCWVFDSSSDMFRIRWDNAEWSNFQFGQFTVTEFGRQELSRYHTGN